MKVSRISAYGLHALMYMVRHATQLPATVATIAKAEGIPPDDLARIFRRLSRAGFTRYVRGARNGYVFVKPPEEISLLEFFETLDGPSLLDDCPLKRCECGGTPENCCIFARWHTAARRIRQLFEEISVATAAWNHPEHRFHVPPKPDDAGKFRIESIPSKGSKRRRPRLSGDGHETPTPIRPAGKGE